MSEAAAPDEAPAAPPPSGAPVTRADVEAAIRTECWAKRLTFIRLYVQIHDETHGRWIPFHPWPSQAWLSELSANHRQIVGLKARQDGVTWYFVAEFLHAALSRPHTTWLMFSRREEDAYRLLERVRGMHQRLPAFLQGEAPGGNMSEMRFTNGSRILTFPVGAGDSYTATGVLLDEYDMLTAREQAAQMRSVKPTTDAGGKLVVISRPDKDKPDSPFKRLYRSAVANGAQTGWTPFFLPWYARPDRTAAWYREICAEVVGRTGSMDEAHELYPATETEALSERQLDKRLPGPWLDACFREAPEEAVTNPLEALTLPGQWLAGSAGLRVYRKPQPGRSYRIGADAAEGLQNSDDTAAEVLDADTLEEVATLAGKFPPAPFGRMLQQLSAWYNGAAVLAERNNHGHAVLSWLATQAPEVPLLPGRDGQPGWQTNNLSKSLLYEDAADVLRERAGVLHDLETRLQLGAIGIATRSAPPGRHDDRAVAWVLAVQAAKAQAGSVYERREMLVLDRRGAGAVELPAPEATYSNRLVVIGRDAPAAPDDLFNDDDWEDA